MNLKVLAILAVGFTSLLTPGCKKGEEPAEPNEAPAGRSGAQTPPTTSTSKAQTTPPTREEIAAWIGQLAAKANARERLIAAGAPAVGQVFQATKYVQKKGRRGDIARGCWSIIIKMGDVATPKLVQYAKSHKNWAIHLLVGIGEPAEDAMRGLLKSKNPVAVMKLADTLLLRRKPFLRQEAGEAILSMLEGDLGRHAGFCIGILAIAYCPNDIRQRALPSVVRHYPKLRHRYEKAYAVKLVNRLDLSTPDVSKAMASMTDCPDYGAQHILLGAIAKLTPEAVPELKTASKGPAPIGRGIAAVGLLYLDPSTPEIVPALSAFLAMEASSTNDRVIVGIIKARLRSMGSSVVPALQAVINQGDGKSPEEAAALLKIISARDEEEDGSTRQ